MTPEIQAEVSKLIAGAINILAALLLGVLALLARKAMAWLEELTGHIQDTRLRDQVRDIVTGVEQVAVAQGGMLATDKLKLALEWAASRGLPVDAADIENAVAQLKRQGGIVSIADLLDAAARSDAPCVEGPAAVASPVEGAVADGILRTMPVTTSVQPSRIPPASEQGGS